MTAFDQVQSCVFISCPCLVCRYYGDFRITATTTALLTEVPLAGLLSPYLVRRRRSFVMNPLNIYIVQTLNAQPSQQNTLVVLMTVPWSFKLIYGFLSDVFPICGLRRKPYLAFGYLLSSACYLSLAVMPQASLDTSEMRSGVCCCFLLPASAAEVPGGGRSCRLVGVARRARSLRRTGGIRCFVVRLLYRSLTAIPPFTRMQVTIQTLSGVLFLATMGQIMGDVMADTLVSGWPRLVLASLAATRWWQCDSNQCHSFFQASGKLLSTLRQGPAGPPCV